MLSCRNTDLVPASGTICMPRRFSLVIIEDIPKIRVGRRIIISKKHFLEWMDANFGKERNNT